MKIYLFIDLQANFNVLPHSIVVLAAPHKFGAKHNVL